VPVPFLTSPKLPVTAELIVAVTPESTLMPELASVSVEPVSVYPFVLNDRLVTDCGAASVTVPAVPEKTASLFAVQATFAEPLNHLLADVSQAPLPPSPLPGGPTFPSESPSASSYSGS